MPEMSGALYEALVALHDHLVQKLEDARVAAAGLLAAERSDRRSSPVAHTQWRSALITHSTTASVLREIVEELEELLAEDEERDARLNPLPAPTVGLSSPDTGDR
jgi:hypothetical protein